MNSIKYCKIRKDLRKLKISVPVGSFYIDSSDPLQYRWVDDQFQVNYLGNWQDAESSDFDL